MWQKNEIGSSYSSINLFYSPKAEEDVWQLRKRPEDGAGMELQNRPAASNDDLSSLDSWAPTTLGSRTSLGSSMSLDSNCTGISSANTTPGGSPQSSPKTKKKKINLKPALKLNMDTNTWTTTKYKRRRHKYKKNIQASVLISVNMNPKDIKKPNVSYELAKDLAFRVYGLTVTSIKRMVSYDDQNFHIQVTPEHQNPYIQNVSPEGYTLKITNTEKTSIPYHFDSMHGALIHAHKKGLKVPVPVSNIEGKTWRLETVPLLSINKENLSQSASCGVHLLTYISGQPVSTVTYTSSILFQWGRLLACFHNAMEDFNFLPLKDKDIFWNLEHVPELVSFLEGLDPAKTELVMSVLSQYPVKIVKNLQNLPQGFIHGDFNENNILVNTVKKSDSGEKMYEVNGILDFEDIHYGTYTWDLGVMLAYTLLDCKIMDPIEGAGHALAGYLSIRRLNALELSALKMCIACRLCQSLVLGAYSYRLDPTNSYLMISAKTGWDRLNQVWNTEDEELLNKWKIIQEQYDIYENFSN